ncbi:MAG: hypothetical protein ABMB14_27575 [Myxococcota bacterium]
MNRAASLALVALAVAGTSCRKVPLFDIQAGFSLADTAWFEDEQTLFVFWQVYAQQGLNDLSEVEIRYTTDDEVVDWTPLSDLPWVHRHVEADCDETFTVTQTWTGSTTDPYTTGYGYGYGSEPPGDSGGYGGGYGGYTEGYSTSTWTWTEDTPGAVICGSASLEVPIEPRSVDLRLRYHPDGELALDVDPVFDVVVSGPAHTNRSLVVYGVLDEANERVQWRARHQFPNLRNEQVEALGLRRSFTIADERYGTGDPATPDNPYGYGASCAPSFVTAGLPGVSTDERARFDPLPLPLGASDADTICATSIVTDAAGVDRSFVATAVARKNPEVRPAFPVLRSPAHDATPIRFFLGPCDRTISAAHERMQRQRLQLEGVPTTCIDHWQSPGFVDSLVVSFRDAVEAQRAFGDDMVLVIGLNQDEPGVSEAVEQALAQVVPDERLRSSPRLAGAFVLDSTAHALTVPELSPVTLWCPSTLPLDELPDLSSRSCAIAPDDPELILGPFTFGTLPILPTREQYLDFIDQYSEAQSGEVESLSFRVPEFSAIADFVPFDAYGAATFLNDERIGADVDDAFSHCVGNEPTPVVFRSDLMEDPDFPYAIAEACAEGLLPDETCAAAVLGLAPISGLPDWHDAFRESTYELGLFWEFPFLLRMDYRVVTAGSLTAFGFSVPFGIASPAESYYGAPVWLEDEVDLTRELTQCGRFCDHPTFDSAGVYHVTDPFRGVYANRCYVPVYPAPGDDGFPRDP